MELSFRLESDSFLPFELNDRTFKSRCFDNPCYRDVIYRTVQTMKEVLDAHSMDLLLYDLRKTPSTEMVFEIKSRKDTLPDQAKIRNLFSQSIRWGVRPVLFTLPGDKWKNRTLVKLQDRRAPRLDFG